VDPFAGVAHIANLRIKERENFGAGQRPFIVVPNATVSFEVWRGCEVGGASTATCTFLLVNPEVNLERSKTTAR